MSRLSRRFPLGPSPTVLTFTDGLGISACTKVKDISQVIQSIGNLESEGIERGSQTQRPASGDTSGIRAMGQIVQQNATIDSSTSPVQTLSRSTNSDDFNRDEGDERKPAGVDQVFEGRAGHFIGTAIISDEFGWRQKLGMSYQLTICPEIDRETSNLVFTKFCLNQMETSVARATFNNETHHPQLRIRRMMVSVEPSIEGFVEPISEQYRDGWQAIERHPSRQYYQMLPGTMGNELSLSGQLNIAANPSATVQLTRKSSSARNTHPITAIINLDRSEFQETPFGGLAWEYNIQMRPKNSEGFMQLSSHKGVSVIPKSNPPSRMEAKVTSIFDIVNNRAIGFPNFGNRSLYRGLYIGYRQCKMVLKVAIAWEGDKITQFPDPTKTDLSSHQLCIRHQFRGGCENTIKPEKAVLGRVLTELAMEGNQPINRSNV